MKLFKTSVLALSLLANSVFGVGLGISVGPFDLNFGVSYDTYAVTHRHFLDNPICNAITDQNRLEIILEQAENVSTKEKKIVTKKIIVEPYAFGVTREGRPILRGNVVEEKLIKEITLKYGDEQFDESTIASDDKKDGFLSGLFTSDKNINIDIRRIAQIQVINGSHFDVPKDYKGITDTNIRVICQLPVMK